VRRGRPGAANVTPPPLAELPDGLADGSRVHPYPRREERARADIQNPVPTTGDVKPYGPPIREAIASGDVTRMQLPYDSGTRRLEANAGDPAAEDVRIALTELESALRAI
jgi:hypothetical protein